jgi:hypothetical protein
MTQTIYQLKYDSEAQIFSFAEPAGAKVIISALMRY